MSEAAWYKDFAAYEPLFWQCLQHTHADMSSAQEASGLTNKRAYGLLWSRAEEALLELAPQIPGAKIIKLEGTPRKLLCIGQYVIFPWRYTSRRGQEITEVRFGTSSARRRLFEIATPPQQGLFEIEIKEDNTTEFKETEYLEDSPSSYKLIILGIASNPHAIHKIVWGESTLNQNGYLSFEHLKEIKGYKENKTDTVWDSDRTFDKGAVREIPITRKKNTKKNQE